MSSAIRFFRTIVTIVVYLAACSLEKCLEAVDSMMSAMRGRSAEQRVSRY